MQLRDYQLEAVAAVEANDGKTISDASYVGGERALRQLVALPTGSGKAQPVDEPVLTPNGWRTMGALRVGDVVVAGDGTATTVAGVFPQGVRPIVRLTCTDGASTRCDVDHLWNVQTDDEWSRSRTWRVLRTADIDVRQRSGRLRWRLPVVGLVQGEPCAVPVDPYVIGVLIADGAAHFPGHFCSGDQDQHIVDRVRGLLPPDLRLTRVPGGDGRHDSWAIVRVNGSGQGNTLITWLRDVGLAGIPSTGRFIPDALLRSSPEQRRSLLLGLWDSDGTYRRHGRRGEYSTSSPQLAADVVELVRSLGGVCSSHSRIPKYVHNGERREGQRSWRLFAALDFDAFARRSCVRRIESIVPAGEVECVCIAVDHPSRTYVTKDHIVTHNTICFSELIRRGGGTALILAHRDELLQQAASKLSVVAPELALNVGFVQAGRNDVHAPIVVASVQTLANPKRLVQLPQVFDRVIVDECHHGSADSYLRILRHVAQSKMIVGVTATPERADKKDLRNAFDTLSYARSLEEMIREGYLCDLRALRVTLDDLDLKRVKTSRGDYSAAALGHAMEEAHAAEHVVAAYLEHAEGKRTVAFFPTIELSEQAAARFQDAGIAAEHLDGLTIKGTGRREREGILRRLSVGDIDVICNVGVLTEGYDEPSLECIIIAAPTRSRIKYAQMVGRGTRLHPGKTDCLILDLAGVSDDLTLQSVGMLFDLKAPPKPGETAVQARDRELAVGAAQGTADGERREAARVRKLAAERRNLFDRDSIQWAHVGERWVLGMKQDQLLVLDHFAAGTAGWRVLLMGESSARVVAKNLDLGYAQGAAEHLVRNAGTVALADKHAPWREARATPGQRGYLYKLGVKTPRGMTKGQAADLITQTIAAQRLERFDRATKETVAA